MPQEAPVVLCFYLSLWVILSLMLAVTGGHLTAGPIVGPPACLG